MLNLDFAQLRSASVSGLVKDAWVVEFLSLFLVGVKGG